MIDVHCHMQFHSFQDDYDEVIKKAFEKGLTRIINTGTQLTSSKAAVEFADKYEHLYAIVGVHPHHADKLAIIQEAEAAAMNGEAIPHQIRNDHELPVDWITELENLTHHPKVIGIGEIGMDYYAYASNGVVDPKLQEEVFQKQIELAHRTKLPLQIHNRQAGDDIIRILEKNKHLLQKIPGMFHCFAGSYEVHKKALAMGFFIGFDGNVTYPGIAKGETTELKEIAMRTPLDRIVIETDSPYLTPIPHRGERNEPQYAILTGQFIADLKGISYASLVEQTTKNVYTIFSKLK